MVTNTATGIHDWFHPVDWGPNIKTGRIADLSPGGAAALGLKTDDIVTVTLTQVAVPQSQPEPPSMSEQPPPITYPSLPPVSLPGIQKDPLSPEEHAALRALARETAIKAAPVIVPLLLKIVAVVFPQAAPWI